MSMVLPFRAVSRMKERVLSSEKQHRRAKP